MKPEKVHTHVFKPIKTTIAVHKYVNEEGKRVKDLITAKDILHQRKCPCGLTETYDLERKRFN